MRSKIARIAACCMSAALWAVSPSRTADADCELCAGVNGAFSDSDAAQPGHSDHREWTILVPAIGIDQNGRKLYMDCFWKDDDSGRHLRHATAPKIYMSSHLKDTIRFGTTDTTTTYWVRVSPWIFNEAEPAGDSIRVGPGGCSDAFTIKPKASGSFTATPTNGTSQMAPPVLEHNTQVSPSVAADG